VAGDAIQAVQFQFDGERFAGKESFQFGGTHLLDVAQAHVAGHAGHDLLDFLVGEPQTAQDVLRHLSANHVMFVKADAVRDAEGGRFANVVQQHRKCQRHARLRGHCVEHLFDVGEDIAFRVEFGWLCHALHSRHFGQQFAQQAALVQQHKAASRIGSGEDFGEFLADTLGADDVDLGSHFLDGVEGVRLDLVAERCGESDAAQHSQFVLGQSLMGGADGADDSPLDVSLSADKVNDLLGQWIIKHPVDGEIASLGVLFGSAVSDGGRASPVHVRLVASEGCHFERVSVLQNQYHAKGGSDGHGFGEHFLNLFGRGGGGNIEVVRLDAAHHVAYATAREISDVPGLTQFLDNPNGGGFHGWWRRQ